MRKEIDFHEVDRRHAAGESKRAIARDMGLPIWKLYQKRKRVTRDGFIPSPTQQLPAEKLLDAIWRRLSLDVKRQLVEEAIDRHLI